MKPNTRHIGVSLRRYRESAGISLDALAAATGITRGAIWKIETSKRPNPTAATLILLADGLGVLPADFFRTESPSL